MANRSHSSVITVQELLEVTPDAFVVSNEAGEIVLLNGVAAQLFGYRRAELLGQQFELLMPARYRAVFHSRGDCFGQLQPRPMGAGPEFYCVRKDGTEIAVEIQLSLLTTRQGKFAVSAIRDLSERKRAEGKRASVIRHEAQIAETTRARARRAESDQVVRVARARARQMSRRAQHDALTALPNRLLLNDRLGRTIALAHRYEKRFALLFLDVDRFKLVNDSLGHSVGDQLLKEIAERLQTCVRSSDTVSRHGGDEFLVLLPDVNDAGGAAVAAGKITAVVTEPYHIAQHDLQITVSIGISIYPEDGQDGAALIEHADMFMYQVKEQLRDSHGPTAG